MMCRVGLIKLGYINIDMKNKISNRFYYTKYIIIIYIFAPIYIGVTKDVILSLLKNKDFIIFLISYSMYIFVCLPLYFI